METNEQPTVELWRIRRLLRETARLAEHASLTGSMPNGAPSAARQYNAILDHLERTGSVPAGFFPRLQEGVSFDELGVASAQLAGFLSDEDEGREGRRKDKQRGFSFEVQQPGGHFDFSELEELKGIGHVIRESLPEWIKWKIHTRSEEPPHEATEAQQEGASESEARLTEISVKLQSVMEQMRQTDLSDAQQMELAEQLAALSREQARLLQRRARRREER